MLLLDLNFHSEKGKSLVYSLAKNEIAHVTLAERPCPAQLLSILAVSVDADTMIAYEADEAADCGRNVGRVVRPVKFDHMGAEANISKLN